MPEDKIRLRHSPSSPFVRKVMAFAFECGLEDKIEIVPTYTWDPATDLGNDNPLGRIPTMITKDGVFIGSLFCCKYLDTLHASEGLIPPVGPGHWKPMKLYHLADGILEAAVASVTETNQRPAEMIYPPFLERQKNKIERTLATLENSLLPLGEPIPLWALTLGCALGYLDFRLPHINWRAPNPNLTSVFAELMKRRSMLMTQPFARAAQPKGTS